MNCFQHIPESRGAIAQPPRGGATKKKADPTTQHALIGFKHPHLPQPSALHNRTCPCPLTSDRTRNARAPTSPRSIGFCVIWDCISSSSSSKDYQYQNLDEKIANQNTCKRNCPIKTNLIKPPPTALAQWLAVIGSEGGYRSLPGGSCDGRNPGEIGVDLPCELAPTSKYPRFDLAIGGAGGGNLKNPRCPREPQPPTWPRPTPPCPLRGGCR